MPFDGSEGAPIELQKAAQWTANYRTLSAAHTSLGATVTKAHFFGMDIINEILAQDGCMGIRIYYAVDDEGQKQLILVGADADEKDQVEGTIADWSKPCPTYCDSTSSLNS